jgi:hypothetical protein
MRVKLEEMHESTISVSVFSDWKKVMDKEN